MNICVELVFPACSRLTRIRPATTKEIGLAYASAIGGGRAGVIETTLFVKRLKPIYLANKLYYVVA